MQTFLYLDTLYLKHLSLLEQSLTIHHTIKDEMAFNFNLLYFCKDKNIGQITPDVLKAKEHLDEYSEHIKAFGRFIYECERERDAFKNHHVNPGDIENIYFVKSSYNHERMKLQSGLFILFGLKYKQDIDGKVIDKSYFRNLIVDKKAQINKL